MSEPIGRDFRLSIDDGEGNFTPIEPMRTCTCIPGDPDPGCIDHGDGSTWELPEHDDRIPDGWLADGRWAP